jgi:hypothetical protein
MHVRTIFTAVSIAISILGSLKFGLHDEWRISMKMFVTVAALAALLVSSPALAKKTGRVSAEARSSYAEQTGPGWQGDTMNGSKWKNHLGRSRERKGS